MNKKTYLAPQLTVVSFRNEKGYASSNPVGLPLTDRLELLFMQNGNEYRETETFSVHNDWTEENGSFWGD